MTQSYFQVSFALAIPGPDFVVALRLWLGIPLFPLFSPSMCLTSIGQISDHLLEYCNGCMKIHNHHALS